MTDDNPIDWNARARATCARVCRWTECTGKGSLKRWAHACKLAPDVELPAPACGIVGCGEPSTQRVVAGYRCPAHALPQPARGVPIVPTPVVEPLSYGTATTDPLGREGAGWVVDDRTKLPKRAPSDA